MKFKQLIPAFSPSTPKTRAVSTLENLPNSQVSINLPLVLDKMDPRCREVLILREYYGLSYQEIGQRLRIREEQVKTLLFCAREQFLQVEKARF